MIEVGNDVAKVMLEELKESCRRLARLSIDTGSASVVETTSFSAYRLSELSPLF